MKHSTTLPQIIRLLTLLVVMFVGSKEALSQIRPVTAVAQSAPPHSGNLSELVAPGVNKIGVSLILNDRNEFNYQVRLEVIIEGGGVRLQTKRTFQPRPITLSFGVPAVLGGAELAEYFDINNLDFQGISRQQYIDNSSLPTGMYNVCFKVFAYDRSEVTPIATDACTGILAVRYDPPIVITPTGFQNIQFPQNLLVQWQAGHVGTFPVEYTLQIYEFDVLSTLTADLLIQFDQPFYERVVNTITTVLVGPAEPNLTPGMRYLIRVRARDITMQHQFVNDGWSAPDYFVYGEACSSPSNIIAQPTSTSTIRVSWTPLLGLNEYIIRYREKGNPLAHWYEDISQANFVNINDLLDGTTYEIQVKAICQGQFEGSFSETVEATTTAIDFSSMDCSGGNAAPFILPTQNTPRQTLGFGDVIQIGAFDMRIIEASPAGADSWSGSGQIRIPWLLNKRYVVTFDQIKVNTQGRVYEGDAVGATAGINSFTDWITPSQANQSGTLSSDFCSISAGLQVSNTSGVDLNLSGAPGPFVFDVASVVAGIGNMFNTQLHSEANVFPARLGSFPNNVVVDNVRFSPTGATLDAFFTGKIPGLYIPTNALGAVNTVFQATGISFNMGGPSGDKKLRLAQDLSALWRTNMKMTIKASEDTFVDWDCRGVIGAGMHGEVEFCPYFIKKLNPITFQPEPGNVKGSFKVAMPAWTAFTAEFSVDPFELSILPGFSWQVENMVIDISESTTPASVVFPNNYNHEDVINPGAGGSGNPRWTGFYLGQARVTVPKAFYSKSNKVFQMTVQHVIIDETGLSGALEVLNLINLEEGTIGDWACSIERIAIRIQSNQLRSGELSGQLKIPAFQGNLAFGCVIHVDSLYLFTVGVGSAPLKMDALVATFELYQNTSLTVSYNQVQKKFSARFTLYGKASLSPKSGPVDALSLANLQVEGFCVSTEAPYLISIGTWAFDADLQQVFAGFPLRIRKLSLSQDKLNDTDSKVTLGIDASLNLSGGEMGIGIDGKIRVVFNLRQDLNSFRQNWSFDGLYIDEFGIDFDAQAFSIKGRIYFYNNIEVYGSGFRGEVELSIMKGDIKFEAIAQFGKVGTVRYFFADAAVAWEPGIPLLKSGFSWYGFGGGISYKMKRESTPNPLAPMGTSRSSVPETVAANIGLSLSGFRYVPDANASLGLIAMVNIGTVKKEIFNGFATFGIIFNQTIGIESITIKGDGRFLTPPPVPGVESAPAIGCVIELVVIFSQMSAEANMELSLNFGPLRGAYDGNVMGYGRVFLSPTEWSMWLGSPDKRVQVSYNLANLLNMAKPLTSFLGGAENIPGLNLGGGLLIGGYMVSGNQLPDFPPVPTQVAQSLNMAAIRSTIDHAAMGDGQGIMIGASLKLGMPDLNFKVFYASFGAEVGFDMMLAYYSQSARCEGDEANTLPIGLNGFLAAGQMWAYLQGKIGINISIGVIKANINILELSAGAALQARFPNPFWMSGIAGGSFSVLGGKVKGNCRFEFEVGQKCNIVGVNELEGIRVIASVQPNETTNTDVDVFVRPKASFNFSINQSFDLEDVEGNTIQYKPTLKSFILQKINSNDAVIETVSGNIRWSSGNDAIDILPADILSGNARYRLTVRTSFERKRPYESAWTQVRNNDGTELREEAIIIFTTGEAPNYIPENNLLFTYPIPRQFNFLPDETSQGVVQLNQGQPYLFKGHPDWEYAATANQWNQNINFYRGASIVASSPFSYNASAKRITFSIPSAPLLTNTIYKFSIDNVPTTPPAAIDANLEVFTSQLLNDTQGNAEGSTVSLDELKAINVQSGYQAQSIYEFHLKTSRYRTFQSKIAALSATNWTWNDLLDPNATQGASVPNFGLNLTGQEFFDQVEFVGHTYGSGAMLPAAVLVEADMSLTGGNWYNDYLFPTAYQHFPNPTIGFRERDQHVLGAVPVRSSRLVVGATSHFTLTDHQISTNSTNVNYPSTSLSYRMPMQMLRDYADLKNSVANFMALNSAANTPAAWVNFYQTPYKYPLPGVYRVVLKYRVPGLTAPTSSVPLNIQFGSTN